MKTDNRRSGVSIRGHLTFVDHGADTVHYRIDATRDGVHEARPLCGNGAYHLRWTQAHRWVTCDACRKAMLA